VRPLFAELTDGEAAALMRTLGRGASRAGVAASRAAGGPPFLMDWRPLWDMARDIGAVLETAEREFRDA
jgi:hypothetical protein